MTEYEKHLNEKFDKQVIKASIIVSDTVKDEELFSILINDRFELSILFFTYSDFGMFVVDRKF